MSGAERRRNGGKTEGSGGGWGGENPPIEKKTRVPGLGVGGGGWVGWVMKWIGESGSERSGSGGGTEQERSPKGGFKGGIAPFYALE